MKIVYKIGLFLIVIVLTGSPTLAWGQADNNTSIENEANDVRLYSNGASVRVVNAYQLTLEVYDVTGVCKISHKIDSSDKTLTLNLPKGLYILKIGKIVRKISIR